MRPRQQAERQAQEARAFARADARVLAIELAQAHMDFGIDVMSAGVVLEPGERPLRSVDGWLRQRMGLTWTEGAAVALFITDLRLVARLPSLELVSLWWAGVVGFEADLEAGHVVLDYGDGRPRLFSGPAAPVVAVAGVAALYGVPAMTQHPALASLRTTLLSPETVLPSHG